MLCKHLLQITLQVANTGNSTFLENSDISTSDIDEPDIFDYHAPFQPQPLRMCLLSWEPNAWTPVNTGINRHGSYHGVKATASL